eukprot:TRINITY_DN16479_c0_g1_i1.p1 TRINITY_DN16479_c0_g1~~TRINITY_DN16479_c0_g1_i1.p1  ORF type:complete len:369 (+),score=79.61 TRINITY_DN16479_c0_g1_i1:95-1201(+)
MGNVGDPHVHNLRVAFEVGRRLLNVEVTFSCGIPRTVDGLIDALQRTFLWDWDAEDVVPCIHSTPISISHLMAYSAPHGGEGTWEYVCRTHTLRPGDQVYAFRKYQQGMLPRRLLPLPYLRVEAGVAADLSNPGSVCAAADLMGAKVNYKIVYDQLPSSTAELVEDVSTLLGLDREAGHRIGRVLLWEEEEDGGGGWGELSEDDVVRSSTQFYCVVDGRAESEALIPEAELEVTGGALLAGLAAVFADMTHSRQRQRLPFADLQSAFAHVGLPLTPPQYKEMFATLPGADRPQGLTFAEFCHVARRFPSLFEYLVLARADFDLGFPTPPAAVEDRARADYFRTVEGYSRSAAAKHQQEERLILSTLGF